MVEELIVEALIEALSVDTVTAAATTALEMGELGTELTFGEGALGASSPGGVGLNAAAEYGLGNLAPQAGTAAEVGAGNLAPQAGTAAKVVAGNPLPDSYWNMQASGDASINDAGPQLNSGFSANTSGSVTAPISSGTSNLPYYPAPPSGPIGVDSEVAGNVGDITTSYTGVQPALQGPQAPLNKPSLLEKWGKKAIDYAEENPFKTGLGAYAAYNILNPPKFSPPAKSSTGMMRPYKYDPITQIYTPQTPYAAPTYAAQGGLMGLATGGSIPDLSVTTYPQSGITMSKYAPQPNVGGQLIDGTGPKIDPFTGAQKLVGGGQIEVPAFYLGAQPAKSGSDPELDPTERVVGEYGENPKKKKYVGSQANGMYETHKDKDIMSQLDKLSLKGLLAQTGNKNTAIAGAAWLVLNAKKAAQQGEYEQSPTDYTNTAAGGGLMRPKNAYAYGGGVGKGGMSAPTPNFESSPGAGTPYNPRQPQQMGGKGGKGGMSNPPQYQPQQGEGLEAIAARGGSGPATEMGGQQHQSLPEWARGYAEPLLGGGQNKMLTTHDIKPGYQYGQGQGQGRGQGQGLAALGGLGGSGPATMMGGQQQADRMYSYQQNLPQVQEMNKLMQSGQNQTPEQRAHLQELEKSVHLQLAQFRNELEMKPFQNSPGVSQPGNAQQKRYVQGGGGSTEDAMYELPIYQPQQPRQPQFQTRMGGSYNQPAPSPNSYPQQTAPRTTSYRQPTPSYYFNQSARPPQPMPQRQMSPQQMYQGGIYIGPPHIMPISPDGTDPYRRPQYQLPTASVANSDYLNRLGQTITQPIKASTVPVATTTPSPEKIAAQTEAAKAAAAADAEELAELRAKAKLEKDRGDAAGGRIRALAIGGLAGLNYGTYAAGGQLLRGGGDGVSDSIPAVIQGAVPQKAALADGEFVLPARIVSEIGNGSTEAGARRLYAMMDRIQRRRRSAKNIAADTKIERMLPA